MSLFDLTKCYICGNVAKCKKFNDQTQYYCFCSNKQSLFYYSCFIINDKIDLIYLPYKKDTKYAIKYFSYKINYITVHSSINLYNNYSLLISKFTDELIESLFNKCLLLNILD